MNMVIMKYVSEHRGVIIRYTITFYYHFTSTGAHQDVTSFSKIEKKV